MSDEAVRKHLRAALAEVISAEKARLHALYDSSDADIADRVAMMKPVIDALDALQSELADVEGLTISLAPHGHMATVAMNTSVSRQSFSLSTNVGTSQFEAHEHTYYTFSSDASDRTHMFSSAEELLAFVVEAVGKHVASNEVLGERKR